MNGQTTTSVFIDDPRVSVEAGGFIARVAAGNEVHRFSVLHTDAFAWSVYTGPDLQQAMDGNGNWLIGFAEADEALRAILGQPIS